MAKEKKITAAKLKLAEPGARRHARVVHDAGGTLISGPDFTKFKRDLITYASGCGTPVYPYGEQAGGVSCGAALTDLDGKTDRVFCHYCREDGVKTVAERIADSLLEEA